MSRTPVAQLSLDELEDDPYPAYRQLRRTSPVAWIPEAEVWFVATFEDCRTVGTGQLGFVGATEHPTLQRVFGDPNVLTAEGAEHADLRAGIDPPLQPAPVSAMVDDLVRPIARSHLAPLAGRTGAELMSQYLEPVSVEALRHVMGLADLVDSDTLRRWFADLNTGVANFGRDPEKFAVADRAGAEIEQVIRPRLRHLIDHPDDSMLSHMLWTGRDADHPRSIDLILPSLKVILLGGMQEPGHAAGSTILGLLSRPDQLAKVYADPQSYVPLAVHEGLRWIAPIGAVERQASRDVELRGASIRTGDIVMTVLGSANRDESRFDDPETFDLERANRPHAAFGNGEHFCAGHFFARQVERIMIEELLTVAADLRLDPAVEPTVTGWVFRAPKSLPVRYDPVGDRPQISLAHPVVSPARQQDTLVLRVEALRREAEAVISVELVDPAGGELPTWEPGAHVDLWVVDSHAAHYSLCGDPDDRHRWRLAILREPASRGASAFVHDELRVGMHVHVGHPRNTFAVPRAKRYHFVAGGIGITPLLPLARAACGRGADVTITYAGRSRERMAFVREVTALAAMVTIHIDDRDGQLDLTALGQQAARDGRTVVACGPAALLDALQDRSQTLGFALALERFDSGQAHRTGDVEFDVHLARAGRTVRVGARESVLDALARDGLELPSVCREGNCGTCETSVLDGVVDHRDVLLTARQRSANDQMMVCVSRSAGSPITLDL